MLLIFVRFVESKNCHLNSQQYFQAKPLIVGAFFFFSVHVLPHGAFAFYQDLEGYDFFV